MRPRLAGHDGGYRRQEESTDDVKVPPTGTEVVWWCWCVFVCGCGERWSPLGTCRYQVGIGRLLVPPPAKKKRYSTIILMRRGFFWAAFFPWFFFFLLYVFFFMNIIYIDNQAILVRKLLEQKKDFWWYTAVCDMIESLVLMITRILPNEKISYRSSVPVRG